MQENTRTRPKISLKLARYQGEPKLTVKCQQEHRYIVTRVLGGTYLKKYDVYIYPFDAIYQFFKEIPSDLIEYTEEVYAEFKRQNHAFEAARQLISGKKEPSEHPFLLRHQRVAVDLAMLFDRYAFFMDTGTGKTLTALEIITRKGGKWLVIVPKPIIRTGWMADADDFFPSIVMAPMSLNYDKKRLSAICDKHGIKYPKMAEEKALRELLLFRGDVVVINPESLQTVLDMAKKVDVVFDGIIVDESTKIKTPKTQITERAHALADNKDTKYFYIMTGEPRPQSEEDYWSQMYCVDYTLLGDNFYGFRGRYFEKHKWLEFKYIFKKELSEQLSNLIARKSYTVKKKDCLDLLEPVTIIREVELGKETAKLYKQMERNFFAQLQDETVTAISKSSALNKLRQIISGFVIDTAAEETHRHGGTEKIKELENVLEELGDEPVVIWISFKEEAKLIQEALGKDKCVIANSENDSDVALEKFMSNEAQYLVAHPASLRYGVTLTGRAMVKNCSYAIYFSKDKNYENFYQSKDRIQRIGQTAQVTYIHLLAANTIDWDIHESVNNKQTDAEFFATLISKYSGGRK